MESRPKTPPLLSRDMSWLAFNYRVLQEAKDPNVPLLERINFMAIFSSNLDEFFKVRVATLRRLTKLKKKTRDKIFSNPEAELEQVLAEVSRQQIEFGEIFRNNLQLQLREAGIFLLKERELTKEQFQFALTYFKEQIKPLLQPVFLTDDGNHLFLKDQSVFLIAELLPAAAPPNYRDIYTIMEVPTKLHGSRFVKLPPEKDAQYVMFIDDVIRIGLPALLPEHDTSALHAIKISRDADLDIGEEISGNLLAKIERNLKKREEGSPARLLIDPGMPVKLLQLLQSKTGCMAEEVVIGSEYHNFRDFFSFPEFNLPELKFPTQEPLPHPAFQPTEAIFEAIARQEILLHYPYQQYEPVIQFFKEAAEDPNVTTISATLYRVANKSEIAKALIKAARKGKFVTVLVELKARFDEESNISWSRKLQKAGAFVIYGIPGYKVHCKIAMVTRMEGALPVNYGYLSTGNFNEKTARVYTDYGFFTSDVRLTKEMDRVFQFFLDKNPAIKFKHLLVAPFNMRKKLLNMVKKEIAFAQEGLPAYIILKLNSLQDTEMIEALYNASHAGVKIDLIVRGICTLVPGVKEISENIKVRSIVDRYLEHPRVYIFGNNGQEKLYLSSADWMTRNLSHRVEVAFPVYDPAIYNQIRENITLQLNDNVKARRSDNTHYEASENQPAIQSQVLTYQTLLSATT